MNRLGIDIGGTTVKFGIVDEDFQILEETAIPTALTPPRKRWWRILWKRPVR